MGVPEEEPKHPIQGKIQAIAQSTGLFLKVLSPVVVILLHSADDELHEQSGTSPSLDAAGFVHLEIGVRHGFFPLRDQCL